MNVKDSNKSQLSLEKAELMRSIVDSLKIIQASDLSNRTVHYLRGLNERIRDVAYAIRDEYHVSTKV